MYTAVTVVVAIRVLKGGEMNKVLIFDIETAPITAQVWGLRDQNIGLNQITEDWYVLSWAAKWLGDPASKVMYQDQSKAKDIRNDKALLKGMWELLNEADIVITQFGTGFDSPKLNARFIMQGIQPPSHYQHLDTYRIAKRVFAFTSNKLEYLTDKLCVKYKKLAHKKFPGMTLWNECRKGNKDAWAEMKKYNIHDVLSTEELYIKLRAWAPETMAKAFVPDTLRDCAVCGACGSVYGNGTRMIKSKRYQRLTCNKCGSWSKGDVIK